jgi:hypothetical protein
MMLVAKKNVDEFNRKKQVIVNHHSQPKFYCDKKSLSPTHIEPQKNIILRLFV